MNKKTIALLAIFTSLMFSQAAFADNEQILKKDTSQQLTKELTKEDLLAATQDYVMEKVERPQARRSALFAHILDTIMVKNATMAKVKEISKSQNS